MISTFHVVDKCGFHREIRLSGRNAWALCELIRTGKRGCTPLDTPGPRWSAYVFNLRHEYDLKIETINEPHKGPYPGTHARYVLQSIVSVVVNSSEAA